VASFASGAHRRVKFLRSQPNFDQFSLPRI
jgi:Pro-kumamolisin, activation domain